MAVSFEHQKYFDNRKIMTECYICLSPGGRNDICSCTNMYIHTECQKEFIRKTNSITCSICRTKFKNIACDSVTLKVPSSSFYAVLFLSSGGCVVVSMQFLILPALKFYLPFLGIMILFSLTGLASFLFAIRILCLYELFTNQTHIYNIQFLTEEEPIDV